MLCSKQYNKIELLRLIVVPKLSSGWQHNYSTNTRQAGGLVPMSSLYVLGRQWEHTAVN
jgi:hypothetical protein